MDDNLPEGVIFMRYDRIVSLLGEEAEYLLEHESDTIAGEDLVEPGPDVVDRVFADSDRPVPVLRNLQTILDHGRLGGTGYVSILPVDQGIEHSGGASFAPNPIYFDPENIVKLALEGGCNAVASTLGVLGSVSRKYAHKIPFIVKLNHNELLLAHPSQTPALQSPFRSFPAVLRYPDPAHLRADPAYPLCQRI